MKKKALHNKLFCLALLTGIFATSTAFAWTNIGIDIINGPKETGQPKPPSDISQKILQMGTGARPATTAENSVAKLAMEKVGPALVGISLYNNGSWSYSGSGVVYSSSAGLIVTNAHVVQNDATVQVSLSNGSSVAGTVLGKNVGADLAVVKVPVPGLVAAEFGDSSNLQLGEVAIVMGNPLSMQYKSSINIGVVSGLNRRLQYDQESVSMIQTDAPINPGNSGGALVNAKGQVVGINTSKLADAEGIGFAIPINTVKNILDRITQEGKLVQSLGSGAAAEGNSVVGAIKQVSPSIIGISRRDSKGQSVLSGSGVIYDAAQGILVTSYTSIKDAEKIVVNLADGRTFEGEILGSDPDSNLAVLRIDATGLSQPSFGDSSLLQLGEKAIVIGNSVGLELSGSVTVGIISGLNRSQQVGNRSYKLIQTDAALNEGNGGSALINEAGQIVGINIAKLDNNNAERIGFAIPINTAKSYINEIIKKAHANRPYLGMNVYGEDWARSNGLNTNLHGGVAVLNVMPNSPVAKAGIKPNDIILSINGRLVPNIDAVSGSIAGRRVGDTIEVKLLRDNKNMVLKVVLEALPE